jgi:hypothetical protein
MESRECRGNFGRRRAVTIAAKASSAEIATTRLMLTGIVTAPGEYYAADGAGPLRVGARGPLALRLSQATVVLHFLFVLAAAIRCRGI